MTKLLSVWTHLFGLRGTYALHECVRYWNIRPYVGEFYLLAFYHEFPYTFHFSVSTLTHITTSGLRRFLIILRGHLRKCCRGTTLNRSFAKISWELKMPKINFYRTWPVHEIFDLVPNLQFPRTYLKKKIQTNCRSFPGYNFQNSIFAIFSITVFGSHILLLNMKKGEKNS